MPTITSEKPEVSARIASPRDRLPAVLWAAAVILTAAVACLRPEALPAAARATAGPFATLAAIIAGSVLAGRLGLFRALARLLIPGAAPRVVAAASVLAFTALLSGLVNLDVAVAITANAASFLLPTSNITSLLLLGRAPLPVLRAAILATAIGPGLVLTGSVATLICRRIARDAGAALSAVQFTAIGAVLVPTQLAAAVAGLHLTGALR